MEAYSSSSSSSSSISTYLSLNSQETKRMKQPYPSQSSLHSVRKQQMKPWKKPIAPLPPTPPRVYKVESANFREVVQQLTGSPEFQSRRLQSVAPPPLNLSPAAPLVDSTGPAAPLQLFSSPEKTPLSALYKDLMNDTLETRAAPKLCDNLSISSPLGFAFSPSSYPWCSFPLLSPGTLSALEQSTVL
ncbi:hypothetical protein VitviT2T_010867 [Vitis vinifera]|uniref:VQ domain-containing protein n=2 Tax=Vitis vinifera TaxID=29760 RepID=F6HJQ9_VITVI|nr:uncharacterized protein LOC104878418 [Vitis vinifera]RVX23474.1 hypothetical protein CK203_000744 [Vitis vinifera]WJZ91824.1 hypothetical protein VitviT2T_010867 [Vitis vinifera]|eukprot:XP_010647074.1 PREDICTED: uncharacterized protein LOC104878418 [Vitis vinifera]